MNNVKNHITVFEHQSLKLNSVYNGVKFDERCYKALEQFYGSNGVPYYSLIHNGVLFNEYVGVIQVGNTLIEVLPKADNNSSQDCEKPKWRDILINMLLEVDAFDVHAPSRSALRLKPNSILDLYFQIFIDEVEALFHKGLIKQYRKTEENVNALKGCLKFNKHIRYNLIHQERFYVSYSIYDIEHQLHFILYKTICLLGKINHNVNLQSRIGSLLLNFPEMSDIKVSEQTFERIKFNRKLNSYKKAIEISKLILLRYHPDVRQGRSDVLALMFDMNVLWESFIYVSLRKHRDSFKSIKAQNAKFFWKPNAGKRSTIIPDIVINKDAEDCTVLDTKWKNLARRNPSPDDLKQMFVYHKYFNAKKVALIYPGASNSISKGNYLDKNANVNPNEECCIICLSVDSKMKQWQLDIKNEIVKWMQ